MAAILAAALLTQPVQGQSGGSLSPEAQANLVTRLWTDTCAAHFSGPAQIRSFAASRLFQKNPPYAQDLLKGQAGTVWDVSLGPHAQNSLVLFDDGKCQVLGRRAKSMVINEVFEKVLQGINAPGLSVQKIVDKEIDLKGVKLRQLAYFVSRTNADQGWVFASTTSDSDKASIQATLTTARGSKP